MTQEELTLKAKQLKYEYMKAYRQKHRQEQKEYTERYWKKKVLVSMDN